MKIKRFLILALLVCWPWLVFAEDQSQRIFWDEDDPCSELPINKLGLVFWSDPNCPRGTGSLQILPDMSGYGRNLEQTTAVNQPSLSGSGRRQGRYYTADDFVPQANLVSTTLSGITPSMVDGTAFLNVDPAKVVLANYGGKAIYLWDASGKTSDDVAFGYIGSPGSGTTVYNELAPNNCATADWAGATESGVTTGWVIYGTEANDTLDAFSGTTFVGTSCIHVKVDAAFEGLYKTSTGGRTGTVYEFSGKIFVVSGSVAPAITNSVSAILKTEVFTTASWKTFNFVATSTDTGANARFLSSGAAAEFYFDDVTFRRLGTPDASGVSIYNTANGNYDWPNSGVTAGINWNDTSYTLEIREPAFSVRGPFTWEGMVWLADGVPAARTTLASKYDNALNFEAISLHVDNSGKPGMIVSGDGSTSTGVRTVSVLFTDAVSTGWVHLAYVYIGASNSKIYLNGEEKAVTVLAGGAPPASVYDNPVPFMIGGEFDSGAIISALSGGIGGNSFWNRALSGAEIVSLYNWRK